MIDNAKRVVQELMNSKDIPARGGGGFGGGGGFDGGSAESVSVTLCSFCVNLQLLCAGLVSISTTNTYCLLCLADKH